MTDEHEEGRCRGRSDRIRAAHHRLLECDDFGHVDHHLEPRSEPHRDIRHHPEHVVDFPRGRCSRHQPSPTTAGRSGRFLGQHSCIRIHRSGIGTHVLRLRPGHSHLLGRSPTGSGTVRGSFQARAGPDLVSRRRLLLSLQAPTGWSVDGLCGRKRRSGHAVSAHNSRRRPGRLGMANGSLPAAEQLGRPSVLAFSAPTPTRWRP